ncbi:somatostatin 1.2 [Odontesthes bonariensis]|uniref:somatostatin 1.2 n=1 Tax=Odontesthes bonariensis TaxID=219752 RepID=UPI003F58DA17
MQNAHFSVFLVLAAVVLCSLGVSSQTDRDQEQFQNQNQDLDLDLELRHHRLLQRARSARLLSQDWSKRAVEDLLAQMSLPEAEAQREAEVVSTATGGRMNLERSVEPQNNVPRERKAGCKNFYWKGFTSC